MPRATTNARIGSTGLKQACPEGVFVSLTPGDSSLWSGVIFVRSGPYAPAILRFQVSFPDTYPSLPPLVTFSTDIFHPLITPLTTYTYSTDIQDGGTVSATDEERLPPGGFSLRHGFPAWFGRETRRRQIGIQPDATGAQLMTPDRPIARGDGSVCSGSNTDRSTPGSAINGPSFMQTVRPGPSTYEVLAYILSTFSSEAALDAITLEAAGNPGAWHAWRTHRGLAQPVAADEKRPGQWNWEGVWEERVKKGIASSLSEAVLFGGAEDVINFLNVEELDMEVFKADLARTVDAAR